jgi:hypothetical protein
LDPAYKIKKNELNKKQKNKKENEKYFGDKLESSDNFLEFKI